MNFRQRAYHVVDDPESAVTIALAGSRFDSSHATRIGLTGSAGTVLCSSSTDHQRRTFVSTVSRHAVSIRRRRCGSIAVRVAFASATMFSSVGYRIPIDAPSSSICTARA